MSVSFRRTDPGEIHRLRASPAMDAQQRAKLEEYAREPEKLFLIEKDGSPAGWLHPERWSHVFVLEQNGVPAAYGSLFSDGDGVGAVAVDNSMRGRGLGTRMTAFLTRESIRRGHPHPCLYCEAGNADALHVYEKLGYRIESSETVAVKTRADLAREAETDASR